MEGRVALAKDQYDRVEVIRVLEWNEDTATISTFVDSNFRLIPLEESKKDKRIVPIDTITFFGRPDNLNINSTVTCILVNNELISTGYIERRDQHPKIREFPVYGSGVRGLNLKRESAIPNRVEVDPGNFFYVKDERAEQFIASVSQRTNEYLWNYIHSHSHNMEQINLLTAGWKLIFHLDNSPNDSVPTEEITSRFIQDVMEDWEALHRDMSLEIDKIWIGFENFPKLILPSPTTIIMFHQGYNSLISYNKNSVIYPPYAADIKYLAS